MSFVVNTLMIHVPIGAPNIMCPIKDKSIKPMIRQKRQTKSTSKTE